MKETKVRTSEFVKSSSRLDECPDTKRPEYAFIGRSNVGKSSLINMLLGRKDLAKTSGKPGKTKLINHFLINDEWLLADLPGYGFAKVSKTERAEWTKMIWRYLRGRTNLSCVFVLVDSRHPPQAIDLEMIDKVGSEGLPIAIIRTKADKIKKAARMATQKALEEALLETWGDLPLIHTTSATNKGGRDEVLDMIENANRNYSGT